MRLTLVISSLSCGGAERVMAIMANYWAAKGWRVTLLTFDDGAEEPFYRLHPNVVHVALAIASSSKGSISALVANLKRLRILRRAIRQSRPDAVIAFLDRTNVLTLLATRLASVPVIVSERSVPRHAPIGRTWNLLRRFCYPFARCIVVQSETVRCFFPPALQRRVRVVPNPVVKPPPVLPGRPDDRKKSVIAMGRLGPEKGFDLLLRAFALVAAKHPESVLTIWGEGETRGPLELLRDQLGLRERVRLPGSTHEPFDKFRAADLFVMSSHFEGFPNALCEAMACGLPVISFDCPSGPREVIRDGTDGILVQPGSVEALAAAMDRLMSDEAERGRLSSRAPEVLQRFGLEKVMAQWNDVLEFATNAQPA